MASGPVLPMVWEGLNVVKTGRVMLGETNPRDSAPGTIRGDFCIDIGRNIIHGSDSVESAGKEIGLWFAPSELVGWRPAEITWVYEDEEEESEKVVWTVSLCASKRLVWKSKFSPKWLAFGSTHWLVHSTKYRKITPDTIEQRIYPTLVSKRHKFVKIMARFRVILPLKQVLRVN